MTRTELALLVGVGFLALVAYVRADQAARKLNLAPYDGAARPVLSA